MRYSIDSSALIEAWRRLYPIDVVPALWEGLDELIAAGDLRATEEVVHEVERKDDDLLGWINGRPALSVAIDTDIQHIVARILADHSRLLDTRKGRSGADPFVIALARQHGACVVTQEHPTASSSRPNIPDVCAILGIRTIDVLQLMREQRWVFRR